MVFHLSLDASGRASYTVQHRGDVVIAPSRLGLLRDDQGFAVGMAAGTASPLVDIDETYELLHGKQRLVRHRARQKTVALRGPSGGALDIVVRIADDGAAFRYRFPEVDPGTFRVTEELTTFDFARPGHAWMQPTQPAAIAAPAYEELYAGGIEIGSETPNPSWNLPALFQTGEHWVLLG